MLVSDSNDGADGGGVVNNNQSSGIDNKQRVCMGVQHKHQVTFNTIVEIPGQSFCFIVVVIVVYCHCTKVQCDAFDDDGNDVYIFL